MINDLRRMKLLYEIYNLFHYDKLKYLTPLYRKYGIHKRYFSSLSSSVFPEDSLLDHPWLDKESSATVLHGHPAFSALNEDVKSALLNWSDDGYAILKSF